MECSGIDDDINDMLDEALDDSQVTLESGPTFRERWHVKIGDAGGQDQRVAAGAPG